MGVSGFGRHLERAELRRAIALVRSFLPRLNFATVRLLDNVKLVNQIAGLERRTRRGRDVIDHSPGSHDDVTQEWSVVFE
jgi:hypothetical protein